MVLGEAFSLESGGLLSGCAGGGPTGQPLKRGLAIYGSSPYCSRDLTIYRAIQTNKDFLRDKSRCSTSSVCGPLFEKYRKTECLFSGILRFDNMILRGIF